VVVELAESCLHCGSILVECIIRIFLHVLFTIRIFLHVLFTLALFACYCGLVVVRKNIIQGIIGLGCIMSSMYCLTYEK